MFGQNHQQPSSREGIPMAPSLPADVEYCVPSEETMHHRACRGCLKTVIALAKAAHFPTVISLERTLEHTRGRQLLAGRWPARAKKTPPPLQFWLKISQLFSAIRQISSTEPFFFSICGSVSAAFGELSAARPERKDPRHERGKSARCEPWPRSAAPGFHQR